MVNLGIFNDHILPPLEIFHGHLVYFVVIWYIFPRFGIFYQEKSGNTDSKNRPKRNREQNKTFILSIRNFAADRLTPSKQISYDIRSNVARWNIFKQKMPILGCLAMKDVGKFYGHFVYFTAIWYILSHLVYLLVVLVYFFQFGYVAPRKIWQP
jgi:hypothetical protein